ncbi:MAG: hypothetical protein M3362_11310 [Acidobacteriota bacterium]|nr:hypothetical protein [Acidobacteriota bacterium]
MNDGSDKQTEKIYTPIDVDLVTDEASRMFLQDLIERHRFHTKLARDLNRRYKRWGPFLMIFIPTYSAVISFLATGVIESRLYLSMLALLLTVATILNSTLKPDEKFVTSSNVLIKLKDWEADMALSLAEVDRTKPELVKELLRKKSNELSEIGSSMARTYLPVKNT